MLREARGRGIEGEWCRSTHGSRLLRGRGGRIRRKFRGVREKELKRLALLGHAKARVSLSAAVFEEMPSMKP